MDKKWEKIMDDYREMSIEELDSIAGGFDYSDMSDRDRKRYQALYAKYRTLCSDYSAGRVSRSEVDEAFQEIIIFGNSMEKKY